MNIKLAPGWLYRAAIVALAVWVLHSFVEALLAGCVAAIASWPLYKRFASRLAPRVGRSTTSLLFTLLMIVFVLAPLIFAFGALLTETQAMLVDIAAADKTGFAVPGWLSDVPLAGSWLASRWQHELSHPGAVTMWTQRADTAALRPRDSGALTHREARSAACIRAARRGAIWAERRSRCERPGDPRASGCPGPALPLVMTKATEI